MGISSDIQRVIVARLKSAVPAVSGRVYDGPSETAQMPYVSIGPSYFTPDDAECISGRSETLQIDVWGSSKPNRAAVKDAVDEVVDALDGYADTAALTMHPLRVSLVRVMDDVQQDIIHGVVQVEAMVELD